MEVLKEWTLEKEQKEQRLKEKELEDMQLAIEKALNNVVVDFRINVEE